MNKKFWISLIVVLLMGTRAFAGSASATAVATVHVESVFSIELNRSDVDFESMRPGELKYDIPASGIKVTTKSNTGNKWYLLINSLSELRDGDKYIDNKYFKWYGWSEGKGKWVGTGEDSMELTPQLAYESTQEEGLSYPDGVPNYFKFKIAIPKSQQPGNYQSTIRFTITE